VTQEDYGGLIRFFREEIKKAKVQLELRLATAVRDNKKRFYKYINDKKRCNRWPCWTCQMQDERRTWTEVSLD